MPLRATTIVAAPVIALVFAAGPAVEDSTGWDSPGEATTQDTTGWDSPSDDSVGWD